MLTYPAAFGHWHLRGGTLQCSLPRKTVTVQAPPALLQAVIRLCSGRLAWREVAAELAASWSHAQVEGFLQGLCREGALVESNELLAHWMELAQPPAPFPQLADAQEIGRLPFGAHVQLCEGASALHPPQPRAASLTGLLQERTSQRTFGDEAISADQLRWLLWAAAGVTTAADSSGQWHRTIASGGNLHGTRWFAAVLQPLPQVRGAQPLAPGLYEARFPTSGGCELESCGGDTHAGWHVLLDPRVLQFASAVLLPVAQLARGSRKYGNRAALFAPLEAGQALQNVQLMAAALGIAGCLQGHVDAASVQDMVSPRLGAGPLLPLPAYVAGRRPSPAQAEAQARDSWVQLRPAAVVQKRGDHAPAFAWSASVGADVHVVGRSRDPRLAIVKAEAEAWERLGWLQPRAPRAACIADLPGAVDPRAVACYTQRQYRDLRFPFRPFHRRRRYLWVQGSRVRDGAVVHLPVDCLHAPTALPSRQACNLLTATSTSGIAAWTNAEGALRQATLELVERQAFLQAWLTREPAAQIDARAVPAVVRQRVRALAESGWQVRLLRLRSEFAAVAGVWIERDAPPFALLTSAAAFDIEEAVHKALDEAEGHAVREHAVPSRRRMAAADVRTPADTLQYWRQPRAWGHASVFTSGGLAHAASLASPCRDWASLQHALHARGLDLLAFDITPPGAAIRQGRTPLHVVRAVIPGWPPIWFQHGCEPAGLPSFQRDVRLGGWPGRVLPPHPFA